MSFSATQPLIVNLFIVSAFMFPRRPEHRMLRRLRA